MSVRASRFLLWLTALFVAPVPFFLVERGRVPVARLLQISGVVLSLVAAEGTRGMVLTLLALLLGQALFFAALLWALAHIVSRLLARLPPRRLLATTMLIVVVAVGVASALEIYRTPFRTRTLSATLVRVYE